MMIVMFDLLLCISFEKNELNIFSAF